MPLPNPEIWGAPETWINAPIMGGTTGVTAETLKISTPKCPDFGTENNKTRLNSGITSGRITANVPLDLTICPCGQDETVSAYGKIAIFNEDGTLSTTPRVVERTSPVNWFMYDQLLDSDRQSENFKVYKNWEQSVSSGMRYEQWSPNATLDYHNPNLYISPYTFWYMRSILMSIQVGCFNSVSGSSVNFTWRTLDDWKNNYSNQSICAVRCFTRPVNTYNSNTNVIEYVNSGLSQYYFGGKIGLLDAIPDIDNNGTITDTTFYSFLKYGVSGRVSFLFAPTGSIDANSSIAILPCWEKFDGQTINKSGNSSAGYTYYYLIPYSDDTYEKIMQMIACFGCYFTPTGKYQFNYSMTDNDLYLPIVGSDGITHGEYTKGADNVHNQLYNVNSIFDFEPVKPVPAPRPKQINVYDINEPQNGFDHNGLAILMPIECISDKEEAGRWDLTLVHPIDDYNKWTYIIGQNVLKVNGQLFRIDETEIYQDAEQSYITAHAKHITYDLFDRFVDEVTVENAGANEYVYKVIKRSEEILPTHRPEPNEYTFNVSSDITELITNKVQDQTVIGALFGDDNSLASRYGGQVYRDNFHMSINSTLENAPQSPAFKLRFGTDLTKLSYKIDFSQWITELICKDNLGNLWGISYTGSTWIIHHQKTRIIHFTYDPETPDPMGCLERDGFAYWQTVSTPIVSIEVSVANLKNDPKYKDFVDLQNLDVGYEGNVYIEQYGIDVNLKIVSIRRDELTGEALQVVLGTSRGSFIRSPVMSQTIVANGTVLGKQEAEMQAMKDQMDDMTLKQMRFWRGMSSYKWTDVQNYTWREILNGHKDNTL